MEGEHGNGEGCHSCHCYSNPQVLCVLGFLSGTLLINSFFVFVFFQFKKVLFLHTKGHVGSFPLQGLNPGPLHWKHSLNHWTTREVQDFLSDGNFNRLVVPVWSLVFSKEVGNLCKNMCIFATKYFQVRAGGTKGTISSPEARGCSSVSSGGGPELFEAKPSASSVLPENNFVPTATPHSPYYCMKRQLLL